MRFNKSDRKTYELVGQWLESYHALQDKEKKAKIKALIVTRMMPIVKRIAKTIARRDYDPVDDLIQAGAVGLLKAIDSYSSATSLNFKMYAGSAIIGEMKHYTRDKMNNIKVPRHIQELAYRINSFIGSLTQEELHDLTDETVSEALNLTKQEIDFAIQADRRKTTVSLEDIWMCTNSHNLSYEEVISGEDYEASEEVADAKLILKEVINKLPDEYRNIVSLYYYEDLPQNAIAERLDMTPMMVSRKLKTAFGLLYNMIADSNWEMPILGS